MASELKVNKITPESGVTLTLGDSGDTINFGSGVLPNFENLTVTGDLTVDTNSLKVDSTNNFVGIGTASPTVALDVVGAITATGNITGTLATAAQPNITSLGTLTGLTTTGDINLGDNDKINLGASNDLQIYHDSGNSYIKDAGTGALYLQSSNAINLRNADGTKWYLDGIDGGALNLYHNNNLKLATTSTGIDVTGNILLDYGSDIIFGDSNNNLESNASTGQIDWKHFGGWNFYTTNGGQKKVLEVALGGDISFYEDTGTTAKFFWDASTEYLGLGTTSPDRAIKIHQDNAYVWIADAAGGNVGFIGGSGQNDGLMRLYEGGGHTARVEIHSDDVSYFNGGNVGIGTSSPECTLHVQGVQFKVKHSTNAFITIEAGSASYQSILEFSDGGGSGALIYDHPSNYLATKVNGLERMRIDSSGNVGIGTTSPNAFNSQARNLVVGTGSGANGITIYSGNTSTADIFFADGTAGSDPVRGGINYNHSNNSMNFRVNDAPKMYILSSGNVGIGTSSPVAKLHIQATAATSGEDLIKLANGADACELVIDTSANAINFKTGTGDDIVFLPAGTEAMRIDSSGNVGIGKTSPSSKLDVNGTVTATAFSGDGSALTGISGGKVAQVVSTTKTDTFSTSSASFTDITGMSVSITPSATSSKILVSVQLSYGGQQNCYGHAKILRGTTSIAQGNTGLSNQSEATFPLQLPNDAASPYKVYSSSMNYLDSPSSTSALTYKVQVSSINFNGGGANFRLNRPVQNDNNAGIGLYVSTITVMEILA